MADQGTLQPEITADMVLGAEAGLRLVRGYLNTNGITAGGGFTFTNLGGGHRRITFAVPFGGIPAVTLAIGKFEGELAACVLAEDPTPTEFEVFTVDVNGDSPHHWSFVAVGPA